MGVIYLLRHAQAPATAYASPLAEAAAGEALTVLGYEQARRAGAAFAERAGTVDYAISGGLQRQTETLRIGMQSCSTALTPVLDSRWNEYEIDGILGGGGRAATMTGAALQHALDEALAKWVSSNHATDDRLETYASYQSRCAAALESVRQLAGPSKTVLVASSSGTITQILAQLWGLDGNHWIRMARTMINASLTKLIVGRGGVSVVSMNEHAHLEGRTGERSWMTFR